jgi:hypothetical protein
MVIHDKFSFYGSSLVLSCHPAVSHKRSNPVDRRAAADRGISGAILRTNKVAGFDTDFALLNHRRRILAPHSHSASLRGLRAFVAVQVSRPKLTGLSADTDAVKGRDILKRRLQFNEKEHRSGGPS